ncbi:hypothetical protein UlMin_006303 [Ulmus minor]
MWALRRAPLLLRNRGFSIRASSVCFPDTEVPFTCTQEKVGISKSCQPISNSSVSAKRLYHTKHLSAIHFAVRRSLSSQVGAKSSGEEDDLGDGFSKPEASDGAKPVQKTNVEHGNEDELISEPYSDDYFAEPSKYELELSDSELNLSVKGGTSSKKADSSLFKAILAAPGRSVSSAVDKWVKEGNEVTRGEVDVTVLNLRKLRMFGRALQLSEWVETTKAYELIERDYSSRLDLICKLRGIKQAEKYIEKNLKSFRGEKIYRTLLANCVQANNVKKAEEVFHKMKDLEFPATTFACDQLMLLYKRHDKKKIADVLLLMEKENVKHSLFTYKLLLDMKGEDNDIEGMEQILETMKAEGIEHDTYTKSILLRHYASGGFKEKAHAILKEMEGGNLSENRSICWLLLKHYGNLGEADEVARIWKICESNPQSKECIAAISAWGKLGKIEEAEAVFEQFLKTGKVYSAHYGTLLKVYANHKMLTKGKDLHKRMEDNGCKICPLTGDTLVKLYVEAGEIEKADSVLRKAAQQNQLKPSFRSYMLVLSQYSKSGDVHNSEKIFNRMRQVGYTARGTQFRALLQAYLNAKTPAYGMRERMKADKIFPTKALAALLAEVDAFRKTTISDLLSSIL